MRTASLAYDAVSLVAALVKTRADGRFSPESLTNPSGFSGVDGIFRFRRDGTCERGLAVMEMRDGNSRVISAVAARVYRLRRVELNLSREIRDNRIQKRKARAGYA